MMNRAAILKFVPDNMPSNPLSLLGTRFASATLSDVPLSIRARSLSETPKLPSSVPPGFVSLQRLHSYTTKFPQETLVIKVATSPEIEETLAAPLVSLSSVLLLPSYCLLKLAQVL
ncbi:hypothetical protein Salat_2155800 [Sesamum alatum]|uniref:Uncharacterized protein n=1 Tax=Sesamum alatum TaxID=300844 RepID=A0AAE1Y1L1_9LAMI|nr:hypothetical protein Salat_2155800 [Sesamum alatum]